MHAVCSGDWFGFDMLEAHTLAPFFHTNVANMDELNNDIVLEHAEKQLPRVEYCMSIGYIAKVFKISGYNEDELFPCFKTAHFTYKYSETDDTSESPTKRLCTAVRVRGGARTRAPRRIPGDDTLPTRPPPTRPPPTPVTARTPMTPVTHRAPAAGKENRSPNLSESDIDHVAELCIYDAKTRNGLCDETGRAFPAYKRGVTADSDSRLLDGRRAGSGGWWQVRRARVSGVPRKVRQCHVEKCSGCNVVRTGHHRAMQPTIGPS